MSAQRSYLCSAMVDPTLYLINHTLGITPYFYVGPTVGLWFAQRRI